MGRTKIEWSEYVWNPITGCGNEVISEGCEHCYARRFAERLKGMGINGYENGFEVSFHPERLEEPYRWKRGRVVFVCSMGDIFHWKVKDEWIMEVFRVMRENPQHKWVLLTKRIDKARYRWWSEVWELGNYVDLYLGVTAENDRRFNQRVEHLWSFHNVKKFVSFEPLLGCVTADSIRRWGVYNGDKLDGVIVGGETGVGAREMKERWVDEIFEVCEEMGIKFFFKQWGGVRGKDRLYRGREWNELPWVNC
jgi:protein gp37